MQIYLNGRGMGIGNARGHFGTAHTLSAAQTFFDSLASFPARSCDNIRGSRIRLGPMLTGKRFVAAALLAALPGPARQLAHSGRESNIRLDVNLVLVPVTVTDRRGASVMGLGKDQFRIFEDKIPQEIVSFAREEAPVSVGVIFDLSGSMKTKIDEARRSSVALFRTAAEGDEAFLVTFSNHPEMQTGFTGDFQAIQGDLMQSKVRGSTALVDAVYLGLNRMRRARNNRKALVIISDGMDNHSHYSKPEMMALAMESDVQIYTVGIFNPPPNAKAIQMGQERDGLALLEDLSRVTGGLHFGINGTSDIPAVADRIGDVLHTLYVIGYHPPDNGERFRKIRVKATVPNVRLAARPGYYAAHTEPLPARGAGIFRP
jgi:Ca-activated chloride channel family protein